MGNRREIIKCYCGSNINLNTVVNSGGINDNGYWKLQCDNCKEERIIKVKNPDCSSIISGASILSREDNVEKEDLLQRILVLEHDEQNDYAEDSNDNSFSLAVCPSCKKKIDEELSLAVTMVLFNPKTLKEEYQKFFNGYVKGWYNEIEKIITYIPVKCNCGSKAKAIFGCEFPKNGDTTYLLKQNFLGMKDLNMENLADGIYSKSECMNILERFSLRWKFIANNIYIMTPYIGHQYTKNNELKDLWEKIKEIFDEKKTKLITRTETHNKYKNTNYDNGIENSKQVYDMFVDYGLENTITSDYIKKNDFHCKLYFAIIGNKVEVLVGSANIMYGKSVENLHFKQYSLEDFTERYIDKLHIKDLKPNLSSYNNLFIDIKGILNNKFEIESNVKKNYEI